MAWLRQPESRLPFVPGQLQTPSPTTAPRRCRRPRSADRSSFGSSYVGKWIKVLKVEAVALVVQELEILLLVTIEDHAHIPRPREHLWIFDGSGVIDVIRIDQRVAFRDVERIAVEIAGPVEPGLVVEMDHVDHERVALPAAARISEPPLDLAGRMRVANGKDVPDRVHVLVQDRELVRLLNNLEREGHVRNPR